MVYNYLLLRSYVGHLLPSIGRALKRDDELVQVSVLFVDQFDNTQVRQS